MLDLCVDNGAIRLAFGPPEPMTPAPLPESKNPVVMEKFSATRRFTCGLNRYCESKFRFCASWFWFVRFSLMVRPPAYPSFQRIRDDVSSMLMFGKIDTLVLLVAPLEARNGLSSYAVPTFTPARRQFDRSNSERKAADIPAPPSSE